MMKRIARLTKVLLFVNILYYVCCCGIILAQQQVSTVDLSMPQPQQPTQPEGQRMTLWSLLVAGGPVMIPLGLSSIIGTALIIDMLVFKLKLKNFSDPTIVKEINNLILAKEYDKAIELCKNSPLVICKAFLAGIEKRDYRKSDIEAIVAETLDKVIGDLTQENMYINSVAVIAPMLGLLGTVTGMINAFNVIAFQAGLGKPELLAKGVSEALITTATGLIIAIPVMAFYFFIRGKIRNIATHLSVLASEFIDNLCYSKRGTVAKEE